MFNLIEMLLLFLGAGKSSFFNSIESAFEGYVSGRANSGLLDESLTTQENNYVFLFATPFT